MINSLTALASVLAFDSRDWSSDRTNMWIYGIVVGWDNTSLEELQAKYKLRDQQISLLDELHADFQARMSMSLDEPK